MFEMKKESNVLNQNAIDSIAFNKYQKVLFLCITLNACEISIFKLRLARLAFRCALASLRERKKKTKQKKIKSIFSIFFKAILINCLNIVHTIRFKLKCPFTNVRRSNSRKWFFAFFVLFCFY